MDKVENVIESVQLLLALIGTSIALAKKLRS